jgi:hypothetical protein
VVCVRGSLAEICVRVCRSQVWLKVEEEQWGRAPSKWGEKKNPPCCLQCLPFYKTTEDLHMKATKERERVHGLREYMEELLPMPWAPLSSGVVGTVNLSGKLGPSGSSVRTSNQSKTETRSLIGHRKQKPTSCAMRSFSRSDKLARGGGGASDLCMHDLHAGDFSCMACSLV